MILVCPLRLLRLLRLLTSQMPGPALRAVEEGDGVKGGANKAQLRGRDLCVLHESRKIHANS